jgi:hypothetical protein
MMGHKEFLSWDCAAQMAAHRLGFESFDARARLLEPKGSCNRQSGTRKNISIKKKLAI